MKNTIIALLFFSLITGNGQSFIIPWKTNNPSLSSSSLSITNYENTLIGWKNQDDLTLGIDGLNYCNDETAGTSLINTYDRAIIGDKLSSYLISWTGLANDNQWNTPNNWGGNAIPTSADQVTINLNEVVEIPVNYSAFAQNIDLDGDADLLLRSGSSLMLGVGKTITTSHFNSRLYGTGIIIGNVNNSFGIVGPQEFVTPGTLTINGDFDNADGILEILVYGTNNSDHSLLTVSGTAVLSGTLDGVIDYYPNNGDRIVFLTANTISGTFDVPSVPIAWSVDYSIPGEVALVYTSSPCLAGGVTLSSQQEIDNFNGNYPNCTVITGNLTIQESQAGNILDLTGIAQLTSIGGNLTISGNTTLPSLLGLHNIESIGGNFTLENNTTLASLSALSNLISIGGQFYIETSTALPNLVGLESLISIGGGLEISNTSGLSSISALSNLTTVGGEVSLNSNANLANLTGLHNLTTLSTLSLFDNPILVDLTGLDKLANVGELSIAANTNMTSLSGLNSLVAIGSDLSISNNPQLVNLNALTNVTTIGGQLFIFTNAALPNLNGLENITSITGLFRLDGNTALADISALNKLTTIGGDLMILNNPALSNLSGLDMLNAVFDNITIHSNAVLSNLNALANLNAVGGEFFIINNPALANLVGLEGLTSLNTLDIQANNSLTSLTGLNNLTSVAGAVGISDSPLLVNMMGLENLASIGSELNFFNNALLASLTGLGNLTTITQNLSIVSNPALIDLNGLQNLTFVGENIDIIDNAKLTSLSGLENISTNVLMNLTIQSNVLLSHCEIQNICTYLAIPANMATIAANAAPCMDRPAIAAACSNIVSWSSLGADGRWDTPANWSTGVIPIASQPVEINMNELVQIPNNYAAFAKSLTLNNSADLSINGGAHLNLGVGEALTMTYPSSVLSGDGTLVGNLIHNNGDVAPGASPGVMTINGDYTNTSGTLKMEINGNTQGADYDLLAVSGTASIDAANSKLNIVFGFTPALNDVFQLITAASVVGTFDLANVTFSGGGVSTISLTYAGGNTVNVTVSSFLPVSLVSFSGREKDGNILLSWQTATESNNAHFNIEHSTDGRTFQSIGKVNGAGNSSTAQNYQFIHQNPTKGINYYRLKQVDFDGSFEYSNIISVKLKNEEDVQIFPNPTTGKLEIIGAKGAEITILDQFGKILKKGLISSPIDISTFPDGLYFIRLKTGNEIIVKRIIKG